MLDYSQAKVVRVYFKQFEVSDLHRKQKTNTKCSLLSLMSEPKVDFDCILLSRLTDSQSVLTFPL